MEASGQQAEQKQQVIHALRRGDLEEAIKKLKAMLEENPEDDFVLYHLGAALSREKRVHEAVECFKKVQALSSNQELVKRAQRFTREYEQVMREETKTFDVPLLHRSAKGATCAQHREEAIYLCHSCQKPLCFRCSFPYKKRIFCHECFQKQKTPALLTEEKEEKEEQHDAVVPRLFPAFFWMGAAILVLAMLLAGKKWYRGSSFQQIPASLEYQLGNQPIEKPSLRTLPANSLSRLKAFLKIRSSLEPERWVLFHLRATFPSGSERSWYYLQKSTGAPTVFPVPLLEVPMKAYTLQARSF